MALRIVAGEMLRWYAARTYIEPTGSARETWLSTTNIKMRRSR
jgi:hypothetical protein